MITKTLQAVYDSRNSFYSKAMVHEQNNKQTLTSYGTEVCYIENGKAFVLGERTLTTSRHIKEFLKQNGFIAENTKQILKDYGVKE